jgi:hypothetical protein
VARKRIEFLHQARGREHSQSIVFQHGSLNTMACRIHPNLREPGPLQAKPGRFLLADQSMRALAITSQYCCYQKN